ncbi:MAG: capsule biosynthesis protein CapK [Deltaproteobacteria bacterium]|nr:MAG: capsule biosynthesis protein CapK [Deltaproteobacteria bacterium]
MHRKIVKNFIVPLHEKIMGRKTFDYLKELEKEQFLPKKDLEKLKFKKLKALLIHAEKNIPFYRKRFAEAGFNPEKMKSIDDFKVLPYLTKEDIRKNLNEMKWQDCPGGLFRYNTGGSTGSPLVFYFDRRRQAYDAAARALTHKWWDIDIGDKELYLWGSPLEISRQDRIKDIRDKITNELLISAFELSEKKTPEIVSKFKKFKPDCLFGYPSTISLFCKISEKLGYRLDNSGVKIVFTTAEVLFDHQKETISRAFGNIPVVDSYGSREGGFVCHQCREGNYHVMDPNYILELVNEGDDLEGDDSGEVVLTHLDAWGMPFIRYRTGDIAVSGSENCRCGRTWSSIKNIQGRTTDFIVTPDGRFQHALSLIYVVRDIEGVDQFKIVQNSVSEIDVLIKIHEDMFPEDGAEKIISGFKKRMGNEILVNIIKTESIPTEASGKFRYVVSKVSID